jgi:hypothetical protein
MTNLRRILLVLSLALAAGCSSAQTPSSATPQVRIWQSEAGARQTILLAVYENGTAILHMSGPPKSIDHWGELETPEEIEFATVRQVGNRTFLIFAGEKPRLLEIADRSGDHLVVWFYAAGFDTGPKTDANLLALPGTSRAPDLELTVAPEPDFQPDPADRSLPVTRFTI